MAYRASQVLCFGVNGAFIPLWRRIHGFKLEWILFDIAPARVEGRGGLRFEGELVSSKVCSDS